MPTKKCLDCFLPTERGKRCNSCKKEYLAEKQREFRKQLKRDFLRAYGGTCQCPCGCKQTEPDYLGLGHIDGSGWRHRKQVGGAGTSTYKDLQDRGWPKHAYRIECWNCNMSRNFYGRCPHEGPKGCTVPVADNCPEQSPEAG